MSSTEADVESWYCPHVWCSEEAVEGREAKRRAHRLRQLENRMTIILSELVCKDVTGLRVLWKFSTIDHKVTNGYYT